MNNREAIKEEWESEFKIANSDFMRCADMTCAKCKDKIKGDYLIEETTNYMLRGNESDKRFLYHRHCSDSNNKWSEYDKEKIIRKKEMETKQLHINEVQQLILKYGLEHEFNKID